MPCDKGPYILTDVHTSSHEGLGSSWQRNRLGWKGEGKGKRGIQRGQMKRKNTLIIDLLELIFFLLFFFPFFLSQKIGVNFGGSNRL